MAGTIWVVTGYGRETVLAHIDPFDLAQAVERSLREMDEGALRSMLSGARERLSAPYREELVRLLRESDGTAPAAAAAGVETFAAMTAQARSAHALRVVLLRFLKSNLRAVQFFGADFTGRVLAACPASARLAAIGEEQPRGRLRPRVLGLAAAVLVVVVAALAGQRAYSGAVLAARAPEPQATLVPATLTALRPVSGEPPHIAVPPRPARTSQPPRPRKSSTAVPVPAQAPVRVFRAAPARPRRLVAVRARPPVARGSAAVEVTPAPSPQPIEAADLPNSLANATPMPAQKPQAVVVPPGIAVRSPAPASPAPARHGWFQRSIMHLDPLHPGAHIRFP